MNKSKDEFKNQLSSFFNQKISRRDFLKIMGFTTAAVTLSACKGPVIRSIPYVIKPERIIPGIPTYYATTMFDGFDLCSVLIKTREGRPIKIESNMMSKYFNITSARIQASLLSLYDDERLKDPYINNKKVSWNDIDEYVIKRLKYISQNGKKIIILSSSLPSPSTKQLINDFSKVYKNTQLVIYDAFSYSSILDATKEILGIRAIPFYEINKIKLIVSFDADFLGDWSPQNMQKDYATNRKPGINMMRHIQIESNMSLSGANADTRISLKPSEIKKILIEVFHILNGKNSQNKIANNIASEIKNKGSDAVVLADGSKEIYALSLIINLKIKSKALSYKKFLFSKESNNIIFNQFINDLKIGNVGALLLYNVNPVYSFPSILKLENYLKKLDLSISFAMKEDETSKLIKVFAPIPHWLESWGDTHPMTGIYTLIQPTIQSLFNTRQFQNSLIIWKNKIHSINNPANNTNNPANNTNNPANNTNNPADISVGYKYYNNNYINNYYDYLRNFWEKNILSKSNIKSFNIALFNGFIHTNEIHTNKCYYNKNYLNSIINNIDNNIDNFELRLYTKTSIGDGTQANNPWLQELPDPITRISWDNYLTISLKDAQKLGIKNWNTATGAINSNYVDIIVNGLKIINIPIFIQPGQAEGSVGLSLGYGHTKGKVATHSSGINAYLIYKNFNLIHYNVIIKKTEGIHEFASIQLQNTMVGRDDIIAKETDLNTFLNFTKEKWNKEEKITSSKGELPLEKISLWKENDNNTGHHFNISIDLNACIGCGTCVIACNVENNVPVVGKNEIRNSRDMYWLRIDRYYSTKESFKTLHKKNISEPKIYNYLLKPENNPKIRFQPIMCQHCNNAPCETVCPVAATSHGKQGQNMMTYNRCVGTRYCANNCPYKVRRFNWFNYVENKKFDFHMNNDLGKMVLNPDVVIRTRGVMEKCSMCIQMTQETILKAKKENRIIKDGEFNTACSKACPTGAIYFGDINDDKSEIKQQLKNNRTYKLLDFLGTRPNVTYQVKIRNLNK
ncbi:MAG: 4Fe-4S dicluster domain-containing protein [Candidatus Bostrichicola ureolyticus]|nr:MAG: 4Fe-4S dicluster domain-containing protein [Candidatus Bostrichicola ureolyticus]